MTLSKIFKYIIGGLFIFSGLIKVNDPVGTSIKMQEYFEVFSSNFTVFFHYLVPISLPISVVLVSFEVFLGIALFANYREKFTNYSLLALIVFFTLLTGYSAITNTVTDCGCFGDAIKLTPWQSFIKDLILMVMIIWVMMKSKSSKKTTNTSIQKDIAVGSCFVFSICLCLYTIGHLPIKDFRAYKINNHIPSEMKPSAAYQYEYVMEKDGKQYTFDSYPSDTSYKYVEMTHTNPEAAPTITDFAIWNDEGDFTEEMLVGEKLFLIFYDVQKSDLSNIEAIKELIDGVDGVDVVALSSSDEKRIAEFKTTTNISIPFYYSDATVLKTIVRSNPGIWLLDEGTVVGKWHHNDCPRVENIELLLSKND